MPNAGKNTPERKRMQIANFNFLIAEDHDFQRSMLVRMLGGLGAKEIHQAADGREALAIVRDPACPVDIVISDLDMPGMDGMEFIRHLGESGIPVSLILASALERKLLASVQTMSEAYGITLLGVLEKPITPGKLETLIRLHKPEAKPDQPRTAGPTFSLEEIASALKHDEFEPFFQPKVDLATGQVKGAEALARWRHAQHGVVAPYAFIKPLEDNGLIDELTWIMLQKAGAFCRGWRATGIDATVSVNLSLTSLSDMKIADRVTERMKGFGLSIDDYGTGYSSMQQLTRIAFTEIKIDQSFVTNAARQESARVILESSLNMAKKLDITAVAEGVETKADWDLLRQLGCDVAQGYYIARPMDSGAYLDWVRDWKQS
jgi:EAL domain-containing protein (putative c-di-GMP-specific phosphodiesterase class I)/DNA-binding NarL/FixJ family response regulator